jgi:hypothetical protein
MRFRKDFLSVRLRRSWSFRSDRVPISRDRRDFNFLRTVESCENRGDAYFEQMIGAVFKNFGYLNRFVNEDLAALRDAARDSEFQKEHAGQAALDVRKALSKAGNAGTSAIKTVS